MSARVFRQAVAAEWGKVWSVRSTWWCLAGGLALMVLSAVAVGAGAATDAVREGGGPIVASEPAVSATIFAQFALVALAMLVVTAEYASGSIRATLQALPSRGMMLAAKAVVVAVVLAVAGVVSALAATLAVGMVLSLEEFGGMVTMPAGEIAQDVLKAGMYFAMAGVLTLGAGLALRSAAGTLTVVFMLLLGCPSWR